MPAIYEHFHTVESNEIDRLGHANNLAYLRWMLAAATAHSAAQGWPTEAYERQGSGWVVRSHQIKYLRSAFEGDALVVRTWVAEFRRASSMRKYKVVRLGDGLVLAAATTEWAYVNYATGALARTPPEVIAAFEIVTV